MAKSNEDSDKHESVKNLWERYERNEIGADDIIERLGRHGAYFDAMTNDLSRITPSSIRNIASTATAARYLLGVMMSSGKYDLLTDTELQDFDSVASQIALGYKTILESKEYKAAEDGISKLVSDFIGKLPAEQPAEAKPAVIGEPKAPVPEPLAKQPEPTQPADASKTTDQTPASPQPKGRRGLLSRIRDNLNKDLE